MRAQLTGEVSSVLVLRIPQAGRGVLKRGSVFRVIFRVAKLGYTWNFTVPLDPSISSILGRIETIEVLLDSSPEGLSNCAVIMRVGLTAWLLLSGKVQREYFGNGQDDVAANDNPCESHTELSLHTLFVVDLSLLPGFLDF